MFWTASPEISWNTAGTKETIDKTVTVNSCLSVLATIDVTARQLALHMKKPLPALLPPEGLEGWKIPPASQTKHFRKQSG